jgi:ATP-dependent protease HslVU (ClpYQ) peptidase subunit
MAHRTLADQLLDAQVRFVLDELSGERLAEVIARDVDDLLSIAATIPLHTVVDAAEVKRAIHRLLATVPASTAASTLVEGAADVVYDGPDEPFAMSDLIAREHVEILVDEALGMTPLAERALDQLTSSPLVATVASRFVARVVGDVLQANRAAAERIPGVGSLMNLGAGAASRVMGAADKQFEQLIGDTAGKGAAFAMRRLNKIVVETLEDPTLRDALLQVWDDNAEHPVGDLSKVASQDDVRRIAALLQEIVIAGAPTEPVAGLVDALVDLVFQQYGEHPVTALLDELDVSRDDLVADLQSFLPPVIEAARIDGRLESLVRNRLGPFFRSPEVASILGS